MKTSLGLTLSIVLALPVVALAQSNTQNNSTATSAQSQASDTMGQSGATAEGVKGNISQDGKTLVADDGQGQGLEEGSDATAVASGVLAFIRGRPSRPFFFLRAGGHGADTGASNIAFPAKLRR